LREYELRTYGEKRILTYYISESFSCFYNSIPEFFSESTYMHVDGSGKHIGVEFSPDFFQKHLTVDRIATILYQVLKQIEFFCGKFYGFVFSCNEPFCSIYHYIANLNRRDFIGDISPSERLNPGYKFFKIEGFSHIIISPNIESFYHIL